MSSTVSVHKCYINSEGRAHNVYYTRTKKRLTRAEVEELISLRNDGESRASLAARFGISEKTVYNVVHGKYRAEEEWSR